MNKNVGPANDRVNVICRFNKYVYGTTNILFTFENRGEVLKQTENRSLQTLLVMVICKNNKYVHEATYILFTFENRGGALKQI